MNNFFVRKEFLGQPKAHVCSKLLQEMNPSSKFNAIYEGLNTLNEVFFEQFTLVCFSFSHGNSVLQKYGDHLYKMSIPVISLFDIGYFGYIRIAVDKHLGRHPLMLGYH